MANNRMYIVHSSGKRMLLAKYYPSTNWYIFHDEAAINTFFEETCEETMWGDTGYKLEFEQQP